VTPRRQAGRDFLAFRADHPNGRPRLRFAIPAAARCQPTTLAPIGLECSWKVDSATQVEHAPATVKVKASSERAEGIDLSVELAGIRLQNPVMTASGTCGYGAEYAEYVDLKRLGAFVTKAISPEPRQGNPPERVVETAAGMLNAIGLANVGLEAFVAEKVPYLRTLGIPIIVNVVGHSVEDYVTVCRRLDAVDCIAGLELNVSCPNVADGLEFGRDPRRLETLVAAVRTEVKRARLIVKLSPNVTDVAETAQGAVAGGADALSVINTLVGMAINVDTWEPMLANRTGGLSGPAIKPVALRMVHQVYTEVAREKGVPLIAMGGITNWRDAVEFLLAGATALAVGTALFVDPRTPLHICEGLCSYLARRGLKSVGELTGQLR
jgi:dihydroorotate dehydrogenase (NAD+) catalytic subunit